MQIDLKNINQEEFNVDPHVVGEEVCYLIIPKRINVSWTRENSILRSVLVNSNNQVISCGFKKFLNLAEENSEFPVPKSLNNTTITTKLDGSLLILSRYKGNYILRTRGTVSAANLPNGSEIEIFKQQILNPFLENNPHFKHLETWDFSLLWEWVSPENVIVINYGDKPDWYLVGCVNHEDYSYVKQKDLDTLARDNNWKRPETYTFTSLTDLVKNIEAWQDKEGVCLYFNNDQNVVKIKSAAYLLFKAVFEHICSNTALKSMQPSKTLLIYFSNLICLLFKIFKNN